MDFVGRQKICKVNVGTNSHSVEILCVMRVRRNTIYLSRAAGLLMCGVPALEELRVVFLISALCQLVADSNNDGADSICEEVE